MAASKVTRASMQDALRGMFVGKWAGLALDGTEVSGGAYARQQITEAKVSITVNERVAGGQTIQVARIANNVAIPFPSPTAVWIDANEIVIFDAQTGGTSKITMSLSNDPDAPAISDTVTIPLGAMIMTLDASAP